MTKNKGFNGGYVKEENPYEKEKKIVESILPLLYGLKIREAEYVANELLNRIRDLSIIKPIKRGK